MTREGRGTDRARAARDKGAVDPRGEVISDRCRLVVDCYGLWRQKKQYFLLLKLRLISILTVQKCLGGKEEVTGRSLRVLPGYSDPTFLRSYFRFMGVVTSRARHLMQICLEFVIVRHGNVCDIKNHVVGYLSLLTSVRSVFAPMFYSSSLNQILIQTETDKNFTVIFLHVDRYGL